MDKGLPGQRGTTLLFKAVIKSPTGFTPDLELFRGLALGEAQIQFELH